MGLTESATWVPPVLAAAAAAAVWVGTTLFLRVRPRRDALEAGVGLRLLHDLKWRELAQLLLQALRERGYEPAGTERIPGDGGFDLLVQRGTERYLVQCKHGGAYQVGAAAVRELLALLPAQDAGGAILVTTGRFDDAAHAAARNQPLQVLEGVPLWRELRPFLQPTMLADVDKGVAARRTRQQTVQGLAAVVAAALTYFAATSAMAPPAAPAGSALAVPAQGHAPGPARVATPAAPSAAVVPATKAPPAKAAHLPGVLPELSEAEQQQRRDAALGAVRAIAGVASADWSTKSTLAVAVHAGSDERRDGLVARVCEAVLAYEELRYTRLQLTDSGAAGDGEARLHWRQCK